MVNIIIIQYSNQLQPALQNLLRVVQFFHPRSPCTTTHISADVQRITLNQSCMMISGGRTKQLDIFCRFTGFTSDFLSFTVVELIHFFHGALQLEKHERRGKMDLLYRKVSELTNRRRTKQSSPFIFLLCVYFLLNEVSTSLLLVG